MLYIIYVANSGRQGRAGVPGREAVQGRGRAAEGDERAFQEEARREEGDARQDQEPGLAGADGAHGAARVGGPLRRAGREGVLPLQE